MEAKKARESRTLCLEHSIHHHRDGFFFLRSKEEKILLLFTFLKEILFQRHPSLLAWTLESTPPTMKRRSGPSSALASPSLLLCLCLALLALTQLANVADARFIVEKAGLRVRFPPEARKLGPISMALGNFGRAFYAGSLT